MEQTHHRTYIFYILCCSVLFCSVLLCAFSVLHSLRPPSAVAVAVAAAVAAAVAHHGGFLRSATASVFFPSSPPPPSGWLSHWYFVVSISPCHRFLFLFLLLLYFMIRVSGSYLIELMYDEINKTYAKPLKSFPT